MAAKKRRKPRVLAEFEAWAVHGSPFMKRHRLPFDLGRLFVSEKAAANEATEFGGKPIRVAVTVTEIEKEKP